MDKLAELEQRLMVLENRLKATFTEIERRFEELRSQQKHGDIGERMTELEDLLLLLQIEVTRLKDKAGAGSDIGITPDTPPLGERLNRLEHEVSIMTSRGGFIEEEGEAESEEPAEGANIEYFEEKETPAEAPGKAHKPEEAPLQGKSHAKKGLLDDVNEILGLKTHA